jgi:hypothetical protein
MNSPRPTHGIQFSRRRSLQVGLPAEFHVGTPHVRVGAPQDNRGGAMALLATAMLTLAGCVAPEQASAPLTPEQQEAEWRVRKFQADIVQALDKVDQARLRTATESKSGSSTNPSPGGAVTSTMAPINTSKTSTGTMPSQAPVILASSTNDPPRQGSSGVADTHLSGGASGGSLAPTLTNPPESDPIIPTFPPEWRPTRTAPPAIDSASPSNGMVISPLAGTQGSVPAAVISPFTLPQAPAASAMVAMASPAPVAIPDPAPTPSLDDALAAVRKMADENPSLKTALALALLNGDKDGHIGQKLSSADQKIFYDLLSALDAMKASSANASLAQRAAPLQQAVKGWQQDSDLTLPRLVLASRVDSFGVFAPVAGTFDQGKRYTVIIYCEVANFASKKSDDGWFSTRLSQQETLITEDGLLVWRPNAEEIEDRSLNQRQDFYLVKKLTIPETLAAGKYSLRMSVTDRNSNKIAVVSLPIEIVSR